MKRAFLLVCLFCSIVSPLGAAAPTCDVQRIEEQKKIIAQEEYQNGLVRTGIKACMYAGVAYILYKILSAKVLPKVPAIADPTMPLTGSENVIVREMQAVYEKDKKAHFFTWLYYQKMAVKVRDWLIQTALVGGAYVPYSLIKQRYFYDPSVATFGERAAHFTAVYKDILWYAEQLETPGYTDMYSKDIQEVGEQCLQRFCSSIEGTLAYMALKTEKVEVAQQKKIGVMAYNFLQNRADNFLSVVWELMHATDKKPNDRARGIVLALNIFERDYQQTIERFDYAIEA